MKTFLLNLCKFCLLLLPFLAMPYIVCLFVIDETIGETIMGQQRVKIDCLAKATSPKIVFVGGSGCSHGINTRTVEKRFGMPVINMGLHAGMGLAYQLQSICPYIRSGDYVFIVPEYGNFSCCLGGQETLNVVCDVCPVEKRKLDVMQWRHLFAYMPAYGMAKIRRILKGKIKRAIGLQKTNRMRDWAYLYNEFGDMTNSWFDVRTKPFKADKGKSVDTLGEDCFNRIRRFMNMHSDAHVFMVPPAYQDLSFDNNVEYIRAIEEALKRNHMPFIASPDRYKMKTNEHWDTSYHLNGKGISVRTERIIEDVWKVIGRGCQSEKL